MDGQTINKKSGAENYKIVNIPDHPFLQSKLEFDIKRLPPRHNPSRGIHGPSWQTGYFESALTDRKMQVRFSMRVDLKF